MVLDNKTVPPLEGGYYKRIGGMWILKHEIISPKLHELIIKAILKGGTEMDLNTIQKSHKDVSQCGD